MTDVADPAVRQTCTLTTTVKDLETLLKVAKVAWRDKLTPSIMDPFYVYRDPERGSTWLAALGLWMSASKVVRGDSSAEFCGAILQSQMEFAASRARAFRSTQITWRLTREGDTVTAVADVQGQQLGEPVTVAGDLDFIAQHFGRKYDELGAVKLGDLADALRILGLPTLGSHCWGGAKLTFRGSDLHLESEAGRTVSIPATVTADSVVCVDGGLLRAALRAIGRRGTAVFAAHTLGRLDVAGSDVTHYRGLIRMAVASKGLALLTAPHKRNPFDWT